MQPRIIAIDWSGAALGSADRIWIAEVDDGSVIRLENGRDRAGIVQLLREEASKSPNFVVGLDFAFSFPAWFLRERSIDDASALWTLAETEGEQWLRDCAPPFWGRPGRGRPTLEQNLRRTDRDVPATGAIRPKSVFQIGGAGAVGTGSIRGMPVLKQLRDSGFAIWPFDAPRFPLAVEIYPRVLTGPVVKSDAEHRRRYLRERYPQIDPAVSERAVASEDAFDALVSALVMSVSASEFESLSADQDPETRLEGKIWVGRTSEGMPRTERGRFNSSKTRVAPIFDALGVAGQKDPQWLRRLLDQVVGNSSASHPWRKEDLRILDSHYERGLTPPVSLLSWLIRTFSASVEDAKLSDDTRERRRRLAGKDPDTVSMALKRLRTHGTDQGWHVLQGRTYPDVYLVTPDALIVVEGKRTEAGATSQTTWMASRDQMLRHIDAAWEIRGRRSVYGFFVVEGSSGGGSGVPAKWVHASVKTVSSDTIRNSLPHRSREEQEQIAACFLGATTWQAIVADFRLDPMLLSDEPDA